jgi:hypothetical protein
MADGEGNEIIPTGVRRDGGCPRDQGMVGQAIAPLCFPSTL